MHQFNHFSKLVKAAFAQRRKTIRNNLKDIAADSDLAAAGINPQDRAEHIAPEAYVVLSNHLVGKATWKNNLETNHDSIQKCT